MSVEIQTVSRFQTGDLEAFEGIVHAESPRMLNFIRRYVTAEEQADDLLQDSWLTIWEIRDQLRSPEKFRSWAYQIARNKIYGHLRAQNWRPKLVFYRDEELHGGVADDAPSPSEEAARAEWRGILRKEVAKLDPRAQEMLVLRFEAGLTLKEISETLNAPYGTVCVTVQRAVKKIRLSLETKGLHFFS